ncbi:helix-turn-helix domain-containing protein [Pannonibacter phragmitetus]|uniref:helix-turn-helix domain-containing protein n=1 Tax=Pannonibacter phragmitetus TaxID=121719 RepID=UPI003D2EF578
MTDTAEALRQWIGIALKTEREKAGLSLSELARRAGLSKSTLSQLEAGSGNPGIETLWMLAVALNIPFSRLVDRPERTTRLVRAGEGSATFSEEAAVRATLLSTGSNGVRRDIYRMDLEPGRARRSPAHIAGTTEHVLVATGRARVGPEAETEELSPGDYYAYPGDTAHLYEALEPGTVLMLVMEHA